MLFQLIKGIALFFVFIFTFYRHFLPYGQKKGDSPLFSIFHFFHCQNNQNIKKGTVPFFFLRCSPFAVDHYSFMGYGLAATATSARE